jgi:hypothetical protein
MNEITREVVYRFLGTNYDTLEKACDAANDRFYKTLRNDMTSLGFSANESFKVAQSILANRRAYADLLNYSLPIPRKDD